VNAATSPVSGHVYPIGRRGVDLAEASELMSRQRSEKVVRTVAGWLVAGVVVAGALTTPRAASPDTAPPLPAPAGPVITVATESALQSAIATAPSGATILIAPGTYQLTSTLWINRAVSDLTVRGATNNRNDVVLAGPGMANASYGGVPHGLWTGGGVTRITVANLTIRDVYFHPLIFNPGTEQPRVYNVRLLDAGEQFLKANPDSAGGGVDGGVVEYSVFEYTTQARSSYTNGVDVHRGQDWIIRHNLFRRIRAAAGLAGPAVLMWNNAQRSVVEGNTFIDCHREISLGLVTRTPDDHVGGIVCNNVIVRSAGAGGDVGIAVFDSPGTHVAHNTVLLNGAYPSAIEYRFADTSGVVIVNNLADRPAAARDGATATLAGNVWSATPDLFVNAGAADLHLTATATAAIDRGVTLPEVPIDWDGQARPVGAAADAGADEYTTAAGPAPPPGEQCGDGLDNDGDGLVDEGCGATPLTAPGRTSRLIGTVVGSTVHLRWMAPISGGPVTGYVVEAGLARGTTLLTAPLGAVTRVSFPGVGAGTYFVRVRAVNGAGSGPSSDDVAVSPGCVVPPAAPYGLTAASNGAVVAFSWRDDTGCANTRYRLLVGTTPGAANVGAVPVAEPAFGGAAPPGRYYVRAVADWQGIESPPSNEVAVLATTGCAPPGVPVSLSGGELSRRIELRWSPTNVPAAEAIDVATPLGYVVEAGTTSGASNLGTFPVGRTTSLAATVGAGAYFIRVRAVTDCGPGPASNELAVTVS
jgi:hypothetical protein